MEREQTTAASIAWRNVLLLVVLAGALVLIYGMAGNA